MQKTMSDNEGEETEQKETEKEIFCTTDLHNKKNETIQKARRAEVVFDLDFILDNIPGAVVSYKFHKEYLEVLACSQGVKQLLGWTPQEFIDLERENYYYRIHAQDYEMFDRTMKQIIKKQSRADVIYRGFKKNGELAWIWLQGHFVKEIDGCPIMEAMLLDVSHTSNMYQTILDQSSSIIMVVDEERFGVLYVNKAAKNLIGEEYAGNYCYKYAFSRDTQCETCLITQLGQANEMSNEIVYRGRMYRQTMKRIVWNGRRAFLKYMDDITEQKQNIAYEMEQKKSLFNILKNVPTGIIVCEAKDDSLNVLDANFWACDLLQLDYENCVGNDCSEVFALIFDEDRSKVQEALHKLSYPNTDVEYEYRLWSRKKDKYIWIQTHGRSVKQPNESLYFYLTFDDVSERKKVENLKRELVSAEQTASAKSDFYSRMSHDMRTPMNGILGIADLSLSDESRTVESMTRDMEKIRESGKYLLGLINDTLDVQRGEAGRMKLVPQVVQCRPLLENTIVMVQNSAKEKGVIFEFNQTNLKMDAYIKVDPVRIKQIMVNILSNAIKFTPGGGLVECSIECIKRKESSSDVVMRVRDTGVGMSKEYVKHHLYEPFSQENNEMSELYAGSGLGLTIVKTLVELMNGHIEVESELGTGTTFIVYITVETVNEKTVMSSRKQSEELDTGTLLALQGKRVLLFEDHPINAEIVKRILENIGMKTIWVKNGKEGTVAFAQSAIGYYDAILMDVRMPVMDGLEATKWIRNQKRADAQSIPVIAMSANAYPKDREKSLQAGMNAHLAKPIDKKALYETLVRYMLL